MSTSSPVASHCSTFALSDSTDRELCEQCESLQATLQNISAAVEEASFVTDDDRDEAVYLANSSTLAIQSWKCHLLRSTHEDQAHLDIIDALDHESVFIANDWR